MFGLTINIFFLLFWLAYLYLIRRKIATIRNGLLIGTICALINIYLLTTNIVILLLSVKYDLGPFFEEGIKFLLLYFYPYWFNITYVESIILGASTGIGFGFVENMFHLENHSAL